MGITARIEAAGESSRGRVLLPDARARARRGQRLAPLDDESAKLANIIGGYGYEPVLATMEACVAIAVAGRVVR